MEVCRLTIFSSHCKNKCFVFFQRSRVLVGSQDLKRTKWKIEYAQRRRLRRKINSTSKSEVFPTWAPLPNPKEMKASLSKVQAFKFILQNAASKLRLFQTSIFKFYLLSPISALLLPTCSTSSFQKLVEKVRNYIKEVWLIFKKWVWRVDFERCFFWKKSVLPRKMSKNKRFFFDRQDEGW